MMTEKKMTTKNHVDVFYYPNCSTHSFCLSLYVKAGCIYESEHDNGITHFLEHLIFRGVNDRMQGKMYERLDQLGLCFNGATYKEFMHLYMIGAPQHFEEAAELFLHVFAPFTLPASQVETEQQRVKAEIREAEERKTLDYFAGEFVWADTPVKNTILGNRGNVSRFNRSRMEVYRKTVFQSENIFFYVTGNVGETDIKGLARRIESCSIDIGTLGRKNAVEIPEGFCCRPLKVHLKNSPYTMVQFSFDVKTQRYTGAELALLYDILFSGESSLIHQELSEKRGWIYSYTSALEKYTNIGRLYFTYEIGRQNLKDSIELVLQCLSTLTNQDELNRRLLCVLPEYTDNAYMIYDDNEGFNWQRAYECHMMNSPASSVEDTRSAYEAVKAERLRDIAREIFRPENLVLSLKGKKRQIEISEIETVIAGWRPCGDKAPRRI